MIEVNVEEAQTREVLVRMQFILDLFQDVTDP